MLRGCICISTWKNLSHNKGKKMKRILIAVFLVSILGFSTSHAEVHDHGSKTCHVFICRDEASATVKAVGFFSEFYLCPGSFCTLKVGDVYKIDYHVPDTEICKYMHYQIGLLVGPNTNLQNFIQWIASPNTFIHCIQSIRGCSTGGGGGGAF